MQILPALLEHADLIAQAVVLLGLSLLAWLEGRFARAPNLGDKWARWQSNVVLYATGAVVLSLVFEPFNLQAIRWGSAWGWGGLAAMAWPTEVKLVLGVLVMDLFQYALHRASHGVPWWWRLHKVHHADTSLDASTALRHHPLELFVNAFVLVMLCAAFGVPMFSILLYTALQQVHTLFCHSNLRLPLRVEGWLRTVLITPDLHAVHHSVRSDEGNANFGMIFPWWDHLFASYIAQPAGGYSGIQMGIAELAHGRRLGCWGLLALPFVSLRKPESTMTRSALQSPTRRRKR